MKKTLLLLVFFGGLSIQTHAAELLHEDFDGTVGEELQLGILPAYTTWVAGYNAQCIVAAGNLSYIGLPVSTGQSAKTMNYASSESGTSSRSFTAVANGGLYASFIMRVEDLGDLTATTADSFFFGLRGSFGGNVLQLRRNTSNTNQFDVGIAGTPDISVGWVGGLAINTDHFIVVGNADVTDETDGAYELWVDLAPDDLGETPPTADASSTWRTGLLSAATFGTDNSTGLQADVYFDELRVGTTFQDVTPPDPIPYSTLFLFD